MDLVVGERYLVNDQPSTLVGIAFGFAQFKTDRGRIINLRLESMPQIYPI